MRNTTGTMRGITSGIWFVFICFLCVPLLFLFYRSFSVDEEQLLRHYEDVMTDATFQQAFLNSIKVSLVSAVITTVLAFWIAYTVHATNLTKGFKRVIHIGILLPMLLPTITYGFAIMYSFGNQGLMTKLVGSQIFSIYGFPGLLIGYVIYTLPPAFLLISNGFLYVDKKVVIVSNLMADSPWRALWHTTLRPLVGAISGAFVLAFILSFTDFGIPASLGGTYPVVATQLYQAMLGAIPSFANGAVIAIIMLLPAVMGVILLRYVDRFHFHSEDLTDMDMLPNRVRDVFAGVVATLVCGGVVSIFLVMFFVPFFQRFPYDLTLTADHVVQVLQSNMLLSVYQNSVIIAVLTAIAGTLLAFTAALMRVRTSVKGANAFDWFAMVANTVPGMVLGISYLLLFNGSSLKGTFTIIVISIVIHYFTTPYLMAKQALEKINPSWETTAALLGDSWWQTIRRLLLPNVKDTLVGMLSYFFIHAMVTISGIIFLVTPETSVMASKIKELQHFAKFNDIFVLSLLIFATNLLVKIGSGFVVQQFQYSKEERKQNMKKWWKRLAVTASLASVIGIIVACSNGAGDEKVVIQTNGDEEAVDAMESALQEAGYDDQYVVQSLGTSELGGKLLAEGENIDADLVTMSSYFLESAQEEHDMFADISFDTKPLAEYPSYYTPILANTGAIFVNEEALKEKGLPMPTSLQDLTDPRFKGAISIPNIMDSSTGWLLVQSIMETYGEEEGKNMLQALVENSGPHLESSGSGPIKKVQAGETVAGFGLRHQAVKAKAEGAPIAFVDPNEGNYSLTESVAVVKKGEEKEALATEMAEVLIKDAREQLLTHYPVALYEGETVSAENKPANPKTYKESLTVELLEKHQTLFQSVQ